MEFIVLFFIFCVVLDDFFEEEEVEFFVLKLEVFWFYLIFDLG